jgi:hypothetical protein
LSVKRLTFNAQFKKLISIVYSWGASLPTATANCPASRGWLVCTLLLVANVSAADAPSWWQTRGVIQTNAVPNDYAALNVGQLKQIGFAAWQELEALPGGAGFLPTFTNAANNYAAVNIGQLKAVATPFYNRLVAVGLATNVPWANSPSTNNYAIANIGQAKKLFSFEPDPLRRDSDGDGLSDLTELRCGRIMAWGLNTYAQCTVPASLSNVIAVAGGYYHTLALGSNGMPVAWGQNAYGQCTVPVSATNIVSVAAGAYHSLALQKSGSVVAWGQNTSGQCTVPASASNAVALAAGSTHSLALCPGGTVVAWGNNVYGQCTVPASATNVVAIAAGDYHNLALRANGTVVAWGQNTYSQCYLPVFVTNVVAVAAGPMHNLAVLANGTVVAWGANNRYLDFRFRYWVGADNPYGQCTVPSAATGVVAVAVGNYHSLALRRDGKVIAWGLNDVGQCSGAANVQYAVSLASGRDHSIALSRMNPLKGDTDDDGMPDGWEVSHGFDPLNAADASQDADNDALSNLEEYLHNTDPRNADTDNDGMTDGWEVASGFNPLILDDATLDTDGDGLSDRDECLHRTNPKVADTDGDGMPDGWEVAYGFAPLNAADGSQDADGDGLTNLVEFTKKTHPRNADTDGDTMPDGWELSYRLNPLNPVDAALDLDMDGILNRREYEVGSDPSAGYFMKETFDNGIPPDWMASPEAGGKWRATWGSTGYGLTQLSSPYGSKGLNVGIVIFSDSYPYGTSSLMTPWMNLGKGMTNAVLSFYFCNPSLNTSQPIAYGDSLYIYCRSRTRDAKGLEVIDVQRVVSLGGSGLLAAQYWKRISVRLPNPSEDCQVAFVYYSDGPHIGVYVDEVSITGDYGRVSQDAAPLVIATASALPSASRGIPYSTRLSVRGGLRPFQWNYQWSVVSNALPEGLALDRNTGIISGTPVSLGPCSFSIEARSEYGKAATNQFAMLVREPVVALSEKFDSGWLPQGWTQEGQNAQSSWTANPGVSPGGMAGSNAWYKGNGTSLPKLISPVMDLSKSTSNVVVRFWYRNPKAGYLNFRDYLIVYCMDGPNLTCLGASGPNSSGSLIPNSDTWTQCVLFLPRLSATTRIAFGAYTGLAGSSPQPGGGVFLDDVEVLADYGDPAFLAWLAEHFPDGAESGFYADPDADGLTNIQEYSKGTDPHKSDTDDDKLKDGDEFARGTNPLIKDSDGDGLEDGAEVNIHNTNPLDRDTDHDGLSDSDELLYGTDPHNTDTDNDGMSDGWEVRYGYPPLVKDDTIKDSDNDGLTDGQEARAGTDPRKGDTDGDGVSDALEVRHGFDPNQFEFYIDSDNDGLPDKLEKAIGTEPNNWDSDGDGMADGWEFNGGLDPLSADGDNGPAGDKDGDGLSNFNEYINGTLPKNPDTDGDGVNDAIEVSQGSDPCDPSDNGQPPPVSELVEVPFSVGDPSGSSSERWQMNIKGKGPKDKRSFNFVNEAFGTVGSKTFKLRRGNSYEITLLHLATDPQYETTDYDWQAQVGGLSSSLVLESGKTHPDTDRYSSLSTLGLLIDNQDGLLGTVDQSFDSANYTAGKKAMVHVLKAALVPDYDRDGKIDAADRVQSDAGEPFRLWINDDKDVGDTVPGSPSTADIKTDIPGQASDPNYKDVTVNGRRDLLDFFPVLIDVGDFERLCGAPDFYRIKQTDKAVNIVCTSLDENSAGWYLTKDIVNCGMGLQDPLNSTAILNVGDEGYTLTPAFVARLRQSGGKGVFLVEGVKASSAPLVIEAIKGGQVIFSSELPLYVQPVEELYEHVSLRSSTTVVTPIRWGGVRPLFQKHAIFIHGFNVDVPESRAFGSEVFKRLWQSGSNAKFHNVTWDGDLGKIRYMDGIFYQDDVNSAFLTAPRLSAYINGLTGFRVVLAHSLGNMVVSSAIADHGMAANKYFMLNAAVAAEAFDVAQWSNAEMDNPMMNSGWDGYASRTWCATWHRLFPSTDDRSRLTWTNRFASVLSSTTVYNYYSSADEVLKLYPDDDLSALTGEKRRHAWQKQEWFKGGYGQALVDGVGGTSWAGWGLREVRDGTVEPGGPKYRQIYPQEANALTDDQLKVTPAFKNTPLPLLQASTITINDRNQLLALGIPALSGPVGSSTIKPTKIENVDINLLERPNNWGRNHTDYGTGWLHSDIINMAFFYNYKLFEDIVNKGGLK